MDNYIDEESKRLFRKEKCVIVAVNEDKSIIIPYGTVLKDITQTDEEFEKLLSVKNWAVIGTKQSNILFFDLDKKNYDAKLNKFFNRTRRSFKKEDGWIWSKHGFIKVTNADHSWIKDFEKKYHNKSGIEIYADKHWGIFAGTYNSKKKNELEYFEGGMGAGYFEKMPISTWTYTDDLRAKPILEFTKEELGSVFSQIPLTVVSSITPHSSLPIKEIRDKDFVVREGEDREKYLIKDLMLRINNNKDIINQDVVLLAYAQTYNTDHCKPPLEEKQVQKCIKESQKYSSEHKENKGRKKKNLEKNTINNDSNNDEKIEILPNFNSMFEDLIEQSIEIREEEIQREIDFGSPITQIEKFLNSQIMEEKKLVPKILRVGFSTYTDTPLNLGILAESSEGKTFAVKGVMKYFPKEDVMLMGGMSPKALINQYGELVYESTREPIKDDIERLDSDIGELKQSETKRGENSKKIEKLENQKKEIYKNAVNLVDLTHMILIFLDNPQPALWESIKTILSHDVYEIIFMTAKGDGSLTVKKTIIRGWPACIFCSAKNESKNQVWDEIITRFVITSPTTSIEKYKKANTLTAKKKSSPFWGPNSYLDVNERKWAQKHINKTIAFMKKVYQKDETVVWSPMFEMLDKIYPSSQGIDMRNFDRVLSFCNVETLINYHDRPYFQFKMKTKPYGDIKKIFTPIGTLEDIIKAFDIIEAIPTVPPEKLRFFNECFHPLFVEELEKAKNIVTKQNKHDGKSDDESTQLVLSPLTIIQEAKQFDLGITSSQLAEDSKRLYGKVLTSKKINENFLQVLENGGYIESWKNEDNKKQNLWKPFPAVTEKTLEEIKSTLIDNPPIDEVFIETRLDELLSLAGQMENKTIEIQFKGKIITKKELISIITQVQTS